MYIFQNRNVSYIWIMSGKLEERFLEWFWGRGFWKEWNADIPYVFLVIRSYLVSPTLECGNIKCLKF